MIRSIKFHPLRWAVFAALFCSANFGVLAYSLLGFSWPSETARFYLNSSSNGFDAAFIEAMQEWNGHSDFSFTYSTTGSHSPCANTNDPDERNSYQFSTNDCGRVWDNGTLAVTYSWFDNNNNTLDADIIFNSGDYGWGVHDGNNTNNNIDFRRVAVHELGHALGLDHETNHVAIMQPLISDTILVPQQDDIDGMRAIYGGLGSSNNDFFVQNSTLSVSSLRPGESTFAQTEQHYVGGSTTRLYSRLGYYLSTNTSLDSGDQLLAEDTSPLRISNPFDYESATLTIPENVTPSSYYILFVADHNNQFSETNEINNSQWISIDVKGPVVAPILYLLLGEDN